MVRNISKAWSFLQAILKCNALLRAVPRCGGPSNADLKRFNSSHVTRHSSCRLSWTLASN